MYANDNNGRYPMNSWVGSHTDSWANLESILGTTLPVDPINTSTSTRNRSANQGNYVYSYHSSVSPVWCRYKAYMLVFNLEGKNGDGDNDGVTRCDGAMRNNGDTAFTVGMNGDGSLITPDLSGTSK
jgi:hypothetical protein